MQLKSIIESRQEGVLIGKCGSNELAMILTSPENRQRMSKFFELHAGVWPSHRLEQWRRDYLNAVANADCLATGWFDPLKQAESEMLAQINPNVTHLKLRDLEPYYLDTPSNRSERWTTLLGGKNVCVVSSFAETMKAQLNSGNLPVVWGEENVTTLVPQDAHYSFIQTKHAPFASPSNTWPEHISGYHDAVEFVVSQPSFKNADVVLIGAGGLGLIIGHRAKELGKIAIVLGGAIQVLFGIKGKRWENHSVISKFWNDAWVHPLPSEIPDKAKQIENGCYW